jgi:Ca2+/H+ antiporter, TMEM165/GDT1 family
MENFFKGALASFTSMFISETGDKTFMIIAVMAQKQPISAILLGNQLAMTPLIALGAYIGFFISYLIPMLYTHIFSAICFLVVSGLAYRESYHEYKKSKKLAVGSDSDSDDEKTHGLLGQLTWFKTFTKTIVLTFLAEWGDTSQLSLIPISALFSSESVIFGASLGMLASSIIAVVIGKIIGNYISEIYTSLIAGTLFLVFFGYNVYLAILEVS